MGIYDPEYVPNVKQQIIGIAQRLHAEGKPFGACLVMDDIDMANQLAPLCNAVVYRQYTIDNAWDGSQMHDQVSASAYADEFWAMWQPVLPGLDKRVFIQTVNERDHPVWHNDFSLRFMQLCDGAGRKAAIFGDSTGTPTQAAFQARRPALQYAMANGHLYVRHNYGPYANGQPSGLPVSTDTAANPFVWSGGYHRTLYASVPAGCRPNLIIGECGPSNAIYTGPDTLVGDMKTYNAMLQGDPVIGFCWWEFAKSFQNPAWEANAALPQIEALIKTL